MTQDACSGDWKLNESCKTENLCTEGKYACCTTSGVCSLSTKEQCASPAKFHDGKQCAPGICGKVVCCASNPTAARVCSDDLTASQCKALGGTVKPVNNVSCADDPCGIGACCSPDGNACVLAAESACVQNGGKSYHGGKVCAEVDCKKPPVECCAQNPTTNEVQCVTKLLSTSCIGNEKPAGQQCGGACQKLYCCTNESTSVCKAITDAGNGANCKPGTIGTGNACGNACPQPDEKKYCCTPGVGGAVGTCTETAASQCPGGGTPMDKSACEDQPACKAPEKKYCCMPGKDGAKGTCSEVSTLLCPDGSSRMDKATCEQQPACMKQAVASCPVGCSPSTNGMCPLVQVPKRSWTAQLLGYFGFKTVASLTPFDFDADGATECCCPQGYSSSSSSTSSVVVSSSSASVPPRCEECAGLSKVRCQTNGSRCVWKQGVNTFLFLSLPWGNAGSCVPDPAKCVGVGTGNGDTSLASSSISQSSVRTSSVPRTSSSSAFSRPASSRTSSKQSSSSVSSSTSSKRRKVSIGFSYVVACEFGYIRNDKGSCVQLATCPAKAGRSDITSYCERQECVNSTNSAACVAACVCGCAADVGFDTTRREAAASCVRVCQLRGNDTCGTTPTATCCRESCIDLACGKR